MLELSDHPKFVKAARNRLSYLLPVFLSSSIQLQIQHIDDAFSHVALYRIVAIAESSVLAFVYERGFARAYVITQMLACLRARVSDGCMFACV